MTQNGDVERPVRVKELGFGQRHVQAFLVFIVVVVLYIMRVSMSTAIISLTDIADNKTHVQTYDWDKKTQDMVLSAFFWGYTIMQIPSGLLAQKYGAKILFILSLSVNGLISITLPYNIHFFNWQGAFASRVFQGMAQSCMMPSVQSMLSKWAPVTERGRLGNFVVGGGIFGTIVGMPFISSLSSHFGWPIAFQAIGGIALATSAIFFWFGSASPGKHSFISAEERNYIQESLGSTGDKKVLKTPWKEFIKSKPLIALIVSQIGMNWGWVCVLLEIPSYLKMALGVSNKESGFYSSLPFLAVWLIGFVLSYVLDKGITNGLFGITAARKIAVCFSGIGSAVGFAVLSFVPTSQVMLSIIVLTISVGFMAGNCCGIMLNPVDLSPNYASLIMAIMNAVSNGIGTQAPITAGMILTDPYDITQWRIVLNLTGGIMLVSAFIFLLFGSGETQPWNDLDLKTNNQTEDPETVPEKSDAVDEEEVRKKFLCEKEVY